MGTDSDWYGDEAVLVRAVRASGWLPPVEPGIPGFADWQELRRGGQGIVYSATQLSTRRRVAVKVLLGGPVASRAQRYRFDREIEVIAGFQHPHIVRLYDRGWTDQGLPYYVMELIEGSDLEEHLGRGSSVDAPPAAEADGGLALRASSRATAPPPIPETLHLLARICEAVAYAHQRGVIHRDLKPANILVDRAGEPHVLDFGLARSLLPGGSSSVMSQTGDFLGTLPWASPEQAEGVPERIDARSDVYALGVILFQSLTGRPPYPMGTLPQAIESIRSVDPPPPSTLRRGLSAELDAIVLKCLAKEAQRRYADAGELAEEIHRHLRGQPVVAKGASLGYRAYRWTRRRRMAAGLISTLVVLGAVGFVAARWGIPPAAARRVDPAQMRSVIELADHVSESDGALTFFAHVLPKFAGDLPIPGSLALGHAGAAGAHTVAAGQRLEASSRVFVGFDGSGRLEIADGGQVADWDGSIGHEAQGRGEVTLDGPGARWENWHCLYLGYRGHGTLDISGGAQVAAIESTLGPHQQGEARARVDGIGSAWNTHLSAIIGTAGAAEVQITGGATVSASFSVLASAPAGRGEVLVAGNGSAWLNRSSIYVGGATACAGGVARVSIEDRAMVSACHLLRVFSGGTVNLSGGMLTVDTCDHTLGGAFDFTGGWFCVNRFAGNLVNAGGTLGLAHSPGVLQVTGDYDQADGALELRIHGPEPGDWDKLVVDGTATLSGRLEIICADGFTPAYDDRVTVLTAGLIHGRFAGGAAKVELVGGGQCDILYTNTQVVLTHFEGPFVTVPAERDEYPSGPLPRPILPEGPCPRRLARNTTGEHDLVFLGPPDDIAVGLAGQMVDYDFDPFRVVDGPGPDFNVYELSVGGAEFAAIDVLVSNDGVTFVSVQSTVTSALRIAGDEAWPDPRFAVSYDLARSGLKQVRYIRVDGDGEAPLGGGLGFDLDAIAAIHILSAEEPASVAPQP